MDFSRDIDNKLVNKIGPKWEPWGTPDSEKYVLDSYPSTDTYHLNSVPKIRHKPIQQGSLNTIGIKFLQ